MSNFFKKMGNWLSGDLTVGSIGRTSDVALAVGLTVILGLIIVPIPSAFLDALIALNITLALSLLMVAIYVPSAVELSVFPSLLLITTLFRLGLNIATTRGILLEANAGHVIFAFGNFVVGGNYVVGLVLFLIITLVQFIVITKGAERVAEVAARFTLDALPGKQMSIDADMRAGILDAKQARAKRLELQKESQLYGAMDGAMKFVKGDAIAGIVITLINLVGGIVIGVFLMDLDVATSLSTFALLSIGDGLVSQIPALMISITAGIITTRVTTDRDSNLGKEISNQLLKQPKGLMIAAAAAFMMGLIPGFPAAPFSILSIILGGVSYVLWKVDAKRNLMGLGEPGGDTAAVQTDVEGHSVIGGTGDQYALTLPVILELGDYLSLQVKKEGKGFGFIEAMIPKMRQALYHELGVRFPGVHVRVDSPSLEKEEYAILLNEVPVIRGRIVADHLLTNEVEETLKRYNLPFQAYKNGPSMPSLWVPRKYESILRKAGIKHWKPLEVLILHLSIFFRHYTMEFVGIQEVRGMLEFLERSFPDLVKEVTRLIPLQKMTEIFRRLVQEQVSIKDLRTIMESLSEWAQSEKDTVLLTEYVRSSLKRYISYKYSQGQSVISVYVLDPEIEDIVRGAIKQTSAGSYLALDPDSVQLILQAFRSVITPPPPGAQPPVVLTAIDVRRFVRKLIEMEIQDVAVVSYQEIIPEIRIQPLGRIQLR
ncbi:type III secretion system export apparatus subunit SctV [Candidatus Similichlamydia laticola]|uniref:Low Calcium Response D (Type III secretion inner membrane protein SctV) n=1 Tax=Candidatus Similichlamydia laticola TaxID=2170265 RepID=A0A369KA34_9BACT|nr:type III secretion system export apparatus subunit SctV [Candidatus Similichlamydia laticola]RDB31459.1 Low Calcium Response D (Type III secretion inner membrane protein SctV) [Candidatus Similichlamydia laticola]